MTPTLSAVHTAFANWLELPKEKPFELIDMALATVVGNRLTGDPLWCFLVGSPSAGKTAILRSLDAAPDVHTLSSLTPQTFLSGFNQPGGRNASLLPSLDGKTLVIKDFGTVLQAYREAKGQILSQLREIYDGAFSKSFGTGQRIDWKGKMGSCAA